MILKLKRTPGIFLVGFMGCGKSTVGRALADEWGWRFVDLDESIEADTGTTIADLFDQRGEAGFRLLETAALRHLMRAIECGRPHVVALGGGAFVQQENFELVESRGVSIWLDCPLETIERRIAGQDHRPLARDMDKFRALYAARKASYSRADYRIDVSGDDPVQAVQQIQALGLV